MDAADECAALNSAGKVIRYDGATGGTLRFYNLCHRKVGGVRSKEHAHR